MGRTPTDRVCTDSKILGTDGQTGITDGTDIRVRRPAVGRKDRDTFVSGKTKQDAVKPIVLTDAAGRVLFCSPVRPGSCVDITQARQLGTGPTPGRRSVRGDPRGRRLPGPGRAARRTGGDTTPPQVQEEQTSTCHGQPCTRSSGVRVSRPDRRFRPGRPSPGSRSRP
ncbi:transposase family protein [Streptomyces mirabilis]|uniref:transposase family protein n=1 Tax=Streptomyces mirabilis TaxID=68239 RepID=UPI00368CB185